MGSGTADNRQQTTDNRQKIASKRKLVRLGFRFRFRPRLRVYYCSSPVRPKLAGRHSTEKW